MSYGMIVAPPLVRVHRAGLGVGATGTRRRESGKLPYASDGFGKTEDGCDNCELIAITNEECFAISPGHSM